MTAWPDVNVFPLSTWNLIVTFEGWVGPVGPEGTVGSKELDCRYGGRRAE